MSDEERLAERLRCALGPRPDLSERKMFGGICFLLCGNMLCGVHRDTWMFRIGKQQHAEALRRPGARPMDITGRAMAGFVFVDPRACDQDALSAWLQLAQSFVRTLPRKGGQPLASLTTD